MKIIRYIVVLSLMASATTICKGQITLNDQLRAALVNLQPAPDPAPFLYELAAHESDESWYVPINYDDTNYLDNWWTVFYEMQHASYSPNLLPETFGLQYQAQEISKTDTIPMGILNLEFNRFKPDAFDSGVYFFWDNTGIWDNPGRMEEPYEENTINPARGTLHDVFLGAPLLEFSNFKNVVFKIDPAFLFYSQPYNSEILLPPTHKFKINFGDNTGWHEFDPAVVEYYTANYDKQGTKIIEYKVEADNDLRYSKCAFQVLSNSTRKTPDETITMDGLSAGIYYGCDNQPILDKVVIAVSGYDFTGKKSIPEFYDQVVSTSQMIMLQNYGYDFVIVDFSDSKEALQNQGNSLIALIENLKCRQQGIENNFVVVGMSSGALVCNYALTKMETPAYLSSVATDPDICYPEQSHNTRLFLSMDSEYQGAFLNIGAQKLMKYFASTNVLKTASSFKLESMNRNLGSLYNDMLTTDGTKQLLMHHIDASIGHNEFGPHPLRTAFLNELDAMGGSPKWCKTVATSNALLNGINQVAFNNVVALPGMQYLDLDLDVNIKILRIVPMKWELDLDLWANPQGSGRVMEFNLEYPNVINLFNGTISSCWSKALRAAFFSWSPGAGKTFVNTFISCLGKVGVGTNQDIANAEPWDIYPGGTIPVFERVYDPSNNQVYGPSVSLGNITTFNGSTIPLNLSLSWLVGLDLSVNSNGSGVATGWAGKSSLDLSISSEMAGFSFTPWQSSLNYSNADSLNLDVISTSTATNMSRTPFDVIVGHAAHANYPLTFPPNNLNEGQKHFSHEYIRKDEVDPSLFLTWMTREIGETHMHLDNHRINRVSKFEAEHHINAGIHSNLRYDYDGSPSIIPNNAMWSQDSGFHVVNDGRALIKAGKEIRLQPGFSVTDSGELHAWIEPMPVCTYSLDELRDLYNASAPKMELNVPQKINISESIVAYPNPTNGDLYIRSDLKAVYQVTNLLGAPLFEGEIVEGINTLSLDNLSTGIYIIQVTEGNSKYNIRILKQ